MKSNFLPIILSILFGIAIGFYLGKVNIFTSSPKLPSSCDYKGQSYRNGEGFSDKCNSCSCQNGQVSCTAMACE